LQRKESFVSALALPLEHQPHYEPMPAGMPDDLAILATELRSSRQRPLLLRSTSNLNRIEELLLEAIVRAHPNREAALDRLMDDITADDAAVSSGARGIDD
jgi:hypothetical protein